ncbi:MAG: hypothetical protein ACO395_07330 [Pontimonas sp.]|jgi:hypothetical protein
MNIIRSFRQSKSKCYHRGQFVGSMNRLVEGTFGPVRCWQAWSPSGTFLGNADSNEQAWGFLLLEADKREALLHGPY